MGLNEHGLEPSLFELAAREGTPDADGNVHADPDRLLLIEAFQISTGELHSTGNGQTPTVFLALAVETACTEKNPEPLRYTMSFALHPDHARQMSAGLALAAINTPRGTR